jgi:hypothetical protein
VLYSITFSSSALKRRHSISTQSCAIWTSVSEGPCLGSGPSDGVRSTFWEMEPLHDFSDQAPQLQAPGAGETDRLASAVTLHPSKHLG